VCFCVCPCTCGRERGPFLLQHVSDVAVPRGCIRRAAVTECTWKFIAFKFAELVGFTFVRSHNAHHVFEQQRFGVQVTLGCLTGRSWLWLAGRGWQWLAVATVSAYLEVRLAVMPSCWTACLHGQPTWSTRRSAGRLLVKLCIEVCCCFYRAFWIRLNQFLYLEVLSSSAMLRIALLLDTPKI
jgi:hypothetical protein